MNYLFTINEKYVEPIKTLLFSISSNNGKANSFYFIYSDISMSCREELRRFAEEKCGSQVFFIQFPELEIVLDEGIDLDPFRMIQIVTG